MFILQFVLVSIMFSGFKGTLGVTEKIRYLSTERPNLTYWSPKYFRSFYVNLTRYRRQDPIYYWNVRFDAKYTCYNNLSIDVYFYQFLSNQYKRSFVEMHLMICDVFKTATLFGQSYIQGRLKSGCPIPPGVFYLYNMSVPIQNLPSNFPFSKGRIFTNWTSTDTNELVLSGHVDMEIKEYKFKKQT